MEGIYQNNLYSNDNYPYQQYRSSAFSDARSCQPNTTTANTPSLYHSAGLNNTHHHNNTNTNELHNHHNHHNHHNNDYHNNNNPSVGWASSSPSNLSWNSNTSPPLPPPLSSSTTTTTTSSRHNSFSGYASNTPMQRPKLTTTVWEDEGTLCYQVDAKSVCVARRQDNDMINGTKLLNVVGMSRGKRDGILKNEKGRVVVKVGAMHLKGVW